MANNDALKSLHASLIDAEKGYDEAIQDSDVGEMKALFEDMRALHEKAHTDVHALLVAKGEQPDESGSFMAMVHKTVISIRSAVTGLDRSSLVSFASGEEHLVSAYDKAIEENLSDPRAVDKLTEEKTQLVAAIARMKSLTI